MVDRQLRRRGIGDERVLAAMGRVPRGPASRARSTRIRRPRAPIGDEQTISQPFIVATMCELLELGR
jgi:protein-L-isoaspartate(D-aspartate) O-methyltransferase